MKILLYSTNYYPEVTGIAKYNTEMAEWLVTKGHKVDVITAMPSYPEWEIYSEYKNANYLKETINGVNVYRTKLYVPNKRNTTAIKRLWMQVSFSVNSLKFWFSSYIKREKYDIIIALCPPLIPLINALVYKLIKRTPIWLHVQDLEFDAAIRLGIVKQKFLSRILNNIETFFFNKVNVLSSITNTMIDRIIQKEIKIKDLVLFPNWSDINFITPLPKSNKFREKFITSLEDKVVMYSGNLGKKQGLEMVLDVALEFKKKDINYIKFVFVGDGVAKESLINKRDQLELENVSFFPVQPLEDLPELLASADVHLVIQKKEAADLVMPSKLTNILSAGRPVIATAEPATTLYEVVETANAGLVIEPEISSKLFKAILEMLNGEMINDYQKNARKYAEEYLDKEVILKQFEMQLNEYVRVRG